MAFAIISLGGTQHSKTTNMPGDSFILGAIKERTLDAFIYRHNTKSLKKAWVSALYYTLRSYLHGIYPDLDVTF